jgi:hypothetical protein
MFVGAFNLISYNVNVTPYYVRIDLSYIKNKTMR